MRPTGRKGRRPIGFGLLFLLAGCGGVAKTDSINPTTSDKAIPPTVGALSWKLPKTVLDADVAYVYASCKMVGGKPFVDAQLSLAVTPRPIPDPNPYGDGSGDMVSIPIADLASFFQDQEMSIGLFPSGILKTFNASAENQTGTIVANVLTSAVRIAAIGFGVPAPGSGVASDATCNPEADQVVRNIKRIEDKLKPLNPESNEAKNLVAQRQALLDRITIRWKQQIDPGVTPVPGVFREHCADEGGKKDNGCIAVLAPNANLLSQAIWYKGNPGSGKELRIALHLDFEHASPEIISKCPDGAPTCAHHPTRITRGTMYREVAHLPVKAYRANSGVEQDDPADAPKRSEVQLKCSTQPCVFPFAQYGIPRVFPYSAGLFEKHKVSAAFLEFGTITDKSYGSSASGVKATSLLSSASGSASGFATVQRNSFGAPEAETLENQVEAARLKSIVDLVNYQQQVEALRAKGLLPQ